MKSINLYRLVVLSLFIFSDFLKYAFGLDYIGYLCILIMSVDLIAGRIHLEIKETLLVGLFILMTAFSLLFWDSMYTIYSYFGIIPALWILKKLPIELFKRVLMAILVINLAIAFYEYIFQTYLYEAVAERNGDYIKLTYNELSGNVIRAKGIFPGPLTLANFALGAAIIFPKDKYIPLITIIICLLANARLGLLACLVIYSVNSLRLNLKLIVVGIIVYVLLNYIIDQSGLFRIFDVFNVKSDNNTARLYFMQSSIELFYQYPMQNILFGNSGALLNKVGNNAESGWLTLLVENGVIGLGIYLSYLIQSFIENAGNKSRRISIIILFFVMSVQTFYLSILGPLWFWIPVLMSKTQSESKN